MIEEFFKIVYFSFVVKDEFESEKFKVELRVYFVELKFVELEIENIVENFEVKLEELERFLKGMDNE